MLARWKTMSALLLIVFNSNPLEMLPPLRYNAAALGVCRVGVCARPSALA